MENKIQNKSWKVAYEVTMMKGEDVLRSATFDAKEQATSTLYAWALAAKAAGELKSIKTRKDKDGVYGYDLAIRGCKELFSTRMEKRVGKA